MNYIKQETFIQLQEILVSYCLQEQIKKRDYKPILTAFGSGRINRLSNYKWFLLMDALGSDNNGYLDNNTELAMIYELAQKNWQDQIEKNYK